MLGARPKLTPRLRFLSSRDDTFAWPIVVVDEFFEEPERLRELALSLDYRERRQAYPGAEASIQVPGWRFYHTLTVMMGELFEAHYGVQVSLTAAPLVALQEAPGASQMMHCSNRPSWFCNVASAQFRRNEVAVFTILNPQTPEQYNKEYPHCDALARNFRHIPFSCVVYLNPEPSRFGGTAFFRHIDSGFVAIPFTHEEDDRQLARGRSRRGLAELIKRITHVGGKPGDWQIVEDVEARFNRLVCFPGNLLHSVHSDASVEPRLDRLRLTLNAFFEVHH